MTAYANINSAVSKSARNYVRQNSVELYNGNARVGELIIDMRDPDLPILYVGNIAGNIIPVGTGNYTGTTYSADNVVIQNQTTTTLIVEDTVNMGNASNVYLGNISNIHIDGGGNSQVLTTNGNGNLTWTYKSTIGDIKYSMNTFDSDGWFKMDGRLIGSLILTPTQQMAMMSLEFYTALPDARNKVLKQKATLVNTVGGNNTITINVQNLPANLSATLEPAGLHAHELASGPTTFGGYFLAATTESDPLAIPIWKREGLPWTDPGLGYSFIPYYSQSNGDHIHNISFGGNDTPIIIENNYLNLNAFVFLGT